MVARRLTAFPILIEYISTGKTEIIKSSHDFPIGVPIKIVRIQVDENTSIT